MALAVCVFITWCAILILALIPKKLSEREMIFVFFVDTVFELSIFTILHLNLKWIVVNSGVENAFAVLTMRLIAIPIMLVISSNVLLYRPKILKWLIIASMVVFWLLLQMLLKWLKVISTPHWGTFESVLMFCGYVAFSALVAWSFHFVGRQEERAI